MMASSSSPTIPADEGYMTRSVSNAIAEKGDEKSNPIIIPSDSSPAPAEVTPEQTVNSSQGNEKSRKSKRRGVARAAAEFTTRVWN